MSGHHHGEGAQLPRLAAALGITLTVFVVEVIGAWFAGSLAVLADAGHMLTDSIGLVFAVVAAALMHRPASDRRTWGFLRAEVIAAALQAMLLLGIGVFVLIEAVRRWVEPPEVHSTPMLVVGAVGLVGNVAALLVLAGGRRASLNMRAAFLEVVNDALGSVAVLVAALVMATTGWGRADVVASVVIGVLILPRAGLLLRDSVSILLEETPHGVDLAVVREHLLGVEHVTDVHDLHASRVSSTLPVLSAHIVVPEECFASGHVAKHLDALQECAAQCFALDHTTFQLEPPDHRGHEAECASRHVA